MPAQPSGPLPVPPLLGWGWGWGAKAKVNFASCPRLCWLLLGSSPRREGAGPSTHPLCRLTPVTNRTRHPPPRCQAGSTRAQHPSPRASPEQSSLWPESFAPRASGGFWRERLQAASTAARPGFTTRSCEDTLAISPESPLGSPAGREGRQKSLSWMGLGSSRAAAPGQSPQQGQMAAWLFAAHPQPACNVTVATPPGWHRGWWPQAGTSRLAMAGRGLWGWRAGEAPTALGTGMAGSRGKSGDFQRTKRLLAASIAGGGEGESPSPAPAGVGKKHKKHREFVFYLPGNPGSIPGMAHGGGPAKTRCCRRRRVQGRRSSIPYAWGDIWGVSQRCDRVGEDLGQRRSRSMPCNG